MNRGDELRDINGYWPDWSAVWSVTQEVKSYLVSLDMKRMSIHVFVLCPSLLWFLNLFQQQMSVTCPDREAKSLPFLRPSQDIIQRKMCSVVNGQRQLIFWPCLNWATSSTWHVSDDQMNKVIVCCKTVRRWNCVIRKTSRVTKLASHGSLWSYDAWGRVWARYFTSWLTKTKQRPPRLKHESKTCSSSHVH